ncbi:MAG: hypothetical protein AAF799_25850 [Myxococcota bacterium]
MKLSFQHIFAALATVVVAATGCALDDPNAPFGEPQSAQFREASGDAPILRVFELKEGWDPFEEENQFVDMHQLHEHLIDQALGQIQPENQITELDHLFDDDNWAERAEAMVDGHIHGGYWYQNTIESQLTNAELSMVFGVNEAGGIVPCVVNIDEGHVPLADYEMSLRITDSSLDGSTLVLQDMGSPRSCGAADGFYFSAWEDGAPSQVNLCPASCNTLQEAVDSDLHVGVDVFIQE